MVRYMIEKDGLYWNEGKWVDLEGGIKFISTVTAWFELIRMRNFFSDNGKIVTVVINKNNGEVTRR